jgi:peptidyl-prolyl cis-trans isomerase C
MRIQRSSLAWIRPSFAGRRPDGAGASSSPGWLLAAPWLFVLLVPLGCTHERRDRTGPAPDARDAVTGLTPAEAQEVLARVGDRTITLGQYAASLARMDRFERLRYQSEERQKELLDEMIRTEILAQEAKKRGLAADPEVQLRTMQALRDELLMDIKRSLPKPEELSEREVREYYASHKSELTEPKRHRVLAIVIGSPEVAKRVAQEAVDATGERWAELAKKYSLDRRGLEANAAPELAGDLGFVSAPGELRGENAEVPEEVRSAVFRLDRLGQVLPEPVFARNKHYIVRLGGVSAARERTLTDADGAIRAELLRQRYLEEERRLLARLAERYPVTIDQPKLERLAGETKTGKP